MAELLGNVIDTSKIGQKRNPESTEVVFSDLKNLLKKVHLL